MGFSPKSSGCLTTYFGFIVRYTEGTVDAGLVNRVSFYLIIIFFSWIELLSLPALPDIVVRVLNKLPKLINGKIGKKAPCVRRLILLYNANPPETWSPNTSWVSLDIPSHDVSHHMWNSAGGAAGLCREPHRTGIYALTETSRQCWSFEGNKN